MSEPTTLLLVRHGTTDANVRVPYILQGSGMDLPLNDNGQRQAEQVAEFLASFPIQRVYASPLLRAVQTAESISVRHSLHVQTVSEIVECNVGVWEGKNWDTIAGEHPKEYVEFHRDPGINPYLGGESYADVLRRALPAVTRLLEQHAGQTIVVVAHNIVNRVILAEWLGLDLRRAKDLQQSNCCVNVVRCDAGRPIVTTMNATFHLSASLG